ncbi:hypothetical protein Q9S78_14115 [Microbacterium sp. KSW-18]|uniref:Uncharacterized protein n=1 Tax=Microbacterium aquilitoris TaxID=3067307 RepID=A0ABU3GM66_9MICO|nr:hypothetical protein [Microbacterium sp. KSW-18]MDT3331803.1 hypothetical protein [Microbacterium sp. KSW-18]
MSGRSSHRRSRQRSAPNPPGLRWWAYAALIVVALGAIILVIAALLEY